MNNFRAAATVRSDGCILIGNNVTCDGFANDRPIRIQTNINHLGEDFSTSKGKQKKIVLSQSTYEILRKESPDIEYRRRQFEVLPCDGNLHTVENTQIRLFPSHYILGSVMPVIRTENGIEVMYSSDFGCLSPTLSLPKVDVLVVDAKSWNPNFKWNYQREEAINHKSRIVSD